MDIFDLLEKSKAEIRALELDNVDLIMEFLIEFDKIDAEIDYLDDIIQSLEDKMNSMDSAPRGWYEDELVDEGIASNYQKMKREYDEMTTKRTKLLFESADLRDKVNSLLED